MDAGQVIVLVFGMLFAVCAMMVASHHHLEHKRLTTGYYRDEADLEPTKDENGYSVVHIGDHYAIGNDFTITNGPDKKVVLRGLVMDKPTRDTIAVKWLDIPKDGQ